PATRQAPCTAAIRAAASAFGQGRESLADRVARIEAEQQRLAGSNQTLELFNRINDLQAEVMALRGELEQQRFEIEQLKQRSREQYLDLDGRLNRLEAGDSPDQDPAAESSGDSGGGIVSGIAEGERRGRDPVADGSRAAPGGAQGPAEPIRPEDERAAYDHAFSALKDGEYAEAARRFQAFEQNFPDGDLASNAAYWLGESYYVTQNYELALETFDRLLTRYPESVKAPDALLKLGYSQYELKQVGKARATLTEVTERYPDSTVARLAQGRLRQMMLDGGN
ncbi:MAG: tol-pal system protein YbgF, partial [Xanthomonadaceae bacterium]|nr:tol-pal system protein YbgF [Xanthomonadaceae bacterium]